MHIHHTPLPSRSGIAARRHLLLQLYKEPSHDPWDLLYVYERHSIQHSIPSERCIFEHFLLCINSAPVPHEVSNIQAGRGLDRQGDRSACVGRLSEVIRGIEKFTRKAERIITRGIQTVRMGKEIGKKKNEILQREEDFPTMDSGVGASKKNTKRLDLLYVLNYF